MPQDTIKAVRATMAQDRAETARQIAQLREDMVKWCCQKPKGAARPVSAAATPAVIVAPPPPPPPVAEGPAQPTVYVSTNAEITAAILSGTPNLLVRLRPGTYSGFAPSGLTFPNVTLTSADPSNRAVMTNFEVHGCSGLTFRDLNLRCDDYSGYYAFQVWDSREVRFLRVKIFGGNGADPQANQEGLGFYNCSDCGITLSEVHTLRRGLTGFNNTRLTVSDNRLHNLGVTGMMFEQTTAGWFDRNLVTGFNVVAGDHPDAIQHLTDNSTKASTKVSVSGNLITRGDGNIGPQGVFMTVNAAHPYPYADCVLADNLLVGTGYNGIDVQSQAGLAFDGLTVSGNTVLSYDGDTLKSWIQLGRGKGAVLIGNAAIHYILEPAISGLTDSGNSTNAPTVDAGAAAIAAWKLAHPDFVADTLSY